ncbi:hypothetical protein [Fuerstiella marisgermanici]|uniref:Uncharacterized protein n=1 Tax=Fuerstiella marisgermanici TaxID=1891926 RepID=A0A1P8WHC6_9PLAN|nr:hypothetical protein [Fuerstiella marisgermanici]APZ93455.1 hypothetical protein Fuma_03073 [Fuerstiella marisgermanici]
MSSRLVFLFAVHFVALPHSNRDCRLNAQTVTATNPLPDNSDRSSTGVGKGRDGSKTYDNVNVQTFTAEESGTLDSISIVVGNSDPPNVPDLRVALATVSSDRPEREIAAVLVPSEDIPDLGVVPDARFTVAADYRSKNIYLSAGAKYAISLSTDTADANYRILINYNKYEAGHMLSYQNDKLRTKLPTRGDLVFEVTVDPSRAPSNSITGIGSQGEAVEFNSNTACPLPFCCSPTRPHVIPYHATAYPQCNPRLTSNPRRTVRKCYRRTNSSRWRWP